MRKKVSQHQAVVVDYEQCIKHLQRPCDAFLKRIEEEAEKNVVPILGAQVGNMIAIIARSIVAGSILESGTGYSRIRLARVLAENSGKFTTIEMDPEWQNMARPSIRKANIGSSAMEMLQGDPRMVAPELLKTRNLKFDMIFMGVPYNRIYFDLLVTSIKALRKVGVLLRDGVFHSGAAIPQGRAQRPRMCASSANILS